MKVRHLTDAQFGSVITEIDLENLTNEQSVRIRSLWNERALLIFPEVYLSKQGQDDFALVFGELEFLSLIHI